MLQTRDVHLIHTVLYSFMYDFDVTCDIRTRDDKDTRLSTEQNHINIQPPEILI